MGLALQLLGPPAIEVDGQPLRVDTRKATALLAHLALEGGLRTSMLRAATPCRVAVAHDQLDHDALRELAGAHRREDRPTTGAAAE